MEMSLKRSTFLLLTAVAAMVISDQEVILDKTRRTQHVALGSSLTLKCSLNTTKYKNFWVAWNFPQSSFNKSHDFPDSISNRQYKTTTTVYREKQDSTSDERDKVLKYHLSNVTEQHSGLYFCTITADIPILITDRSNGTELIITKSKGHTTYPSLPIVTGKQDKFQFKEQWMWIVLGVSAFILIVLLVICALLRRGRRTNREDPIYANTRSVANQQPSPRPGGENLKPVSSFQKPRNPNQGRRYEEDRRRLKP